MFKAKQELSAYEREKLRVERLKARNEERAKRLLNAKQRIYGRDTAALEDQAKLKIEREAAERARNIALDKKRTAEAKILSSIENERQEMRRKEAEELAAFRKLQRLEKQKRDAEELAYRKSDGGPTVRNTDTLFLQFHGEDPNMEARTKMQKQQQTEWIVQQIKEKEAAVKAEKDLTLKYAKFTADVAQTCMDADSAKEIAKIRAAYKTAAENQQLVMAKKERDRLSKLEEAKIAEEENVLIDDSEGSKLRYDFKGFTLEEKQRILAERTKQIEAKRERQEKDAAAEMAYHEQQEMYRRQLVLMERQRHCEQAEEAQKLAQFHSGQKMEKSERTKQIQEMYKGKIAPEFFDQFGKSHR
mmetsp:Transcript_10301/g.18803  ORF Transcript_10301/g.18803 Transcript_10301/m.18803 type:complete len:359 (+) Transcript_10301:193-1269(+)|eukprot:CAMPEP_0197516952 /NCGR_PEP_ID=MMETSP1318-20131121/1905_1 /TAXON_ID=552666 /ORGANISM="Partenskyella glossopodia, Strain RCC365" /LENGTH=358 /DNA_ID=CAMNT_0043066125 /DNA_START=114 /DNA_END=1190 /DNA_ORIENTATION=+